MTTLGIRQRLSLALAVLLTACTVILTLYLITEARRALLASVQARAQTTAQRLAEEAGLHLHAGNSPAIEALLGTAMRQPEMISAVIDQGSRVYGRGGRPDRPSGTLEWVMVDGVRVVEASVPILIPSATDVLSDDALFGQPARSEPQGRVTVYLSLEPMFGQLRALMTNVLVGLAAVLCAGLLIGWGISARMVLPLRRLAERARGWTDDEGGPRGSDQPENAGEISDEIGCLEESLIGMRRALEVRTAEIARLEDHLEATVQKRTADLRDLNGRLSEVLRLKNELLLQLSHEVKTPLTALGSLIANLRDGFVGPTTQRQNDYLDRISDLSVRIRQLLAVLLRFALAETGDIRLDRRPVDLRDMTEHVLSALEPIQDERALRCIVGASLEGLLAFADRDRVEQILMNLVHNAIKASPPGAQVRVEAGERDTEIVIAVVDSGRGIAASDQAKLLREPIGPSDHGGDGVGLYISRYLIELHGGRLWFESEAGKGSTFFFTLPKAGQPVQEPV